MAITYTLVNDNDGNFVLDGKTVKIAKQLASGTSYSAIIRATDTNGWSKTITVNFTTENGLQISNPSTFTVLENSAYVINLAANEAVTWTKSGPDSSAFTLSGSVLTLTPKDYENPLDTDTDNTYVVQVTATNSSGATATKIITGTVVNVLEGTPATLTPTTANVLSNVSAGAVILDLPSLVEGEERSITPNDGRFVFNTAGKLIRGMSAIAAGSFTGTITRTRGGQPLDTTNITLTITNASSGTTAPTDITLTPVNRQYIDGHTVETWRGREVLQATANAADCRIEVVNGPYFSQGLLGQTHSISTSGMTQGSVGSTKTLTLRATNSGGSFDKTFTMTTKKFEIDATKVLAFWNYADPTSVEVDSTNNRVKKVVCKYTGRIREHTGGYANAPGTNAPVFNPTTKRMTLTAASQQMLKLAPDAINDPIRAFLSTGKRPMTHIIFYATSSPTTQQGLVDWRNLTTGPQAGLVSGGSRLAIRLSNTSTGAITLLRADDITPTLPSPNNVISQQSIFGATGVNDYNINTIPANVPQYAAYISTGLEAYGHYANQSYNVMIDELKNTSTTIDDVELGRTTGSNYFNGVILGEIIFNNTVCPSEIRGIYSNMKDEWGLPDLVDPEVFPFASREDTAFYDTGYEGIQINPTFETDFVKPTGWVPQIGDTRTNKAGVTPSNDTESAYHIDPRYAGAENLKNVEKTSDGKLWLRFKPRPTANIDSGLKSYIAGLSSGRYRHVGSAISTRHFVAPGPTHTVELFLKNPPNIRGNFACYGWTLSEGGGHPPETDWIEQNGNGRISHGLHQNPRWPLIGTRQVTGGNGGAPRSDTDREQHSYQYIFDAVTDTIKYYQDGYLVSTQQSPKGLRINSLKAFKADLIAGVGRGTNILADNGTTTGTLRVSIMGGGLTNTTATRSAKFTTKIVSGEMVDFYWDNQSDSFSGSAVTTFNQGNYTSSETVSPLLLRKANGTSSITFSGGSGTLPDISKIQVGINDPVVPEGYHLAQYLISNNAASGFTGTATDDQSSEGYVSRVRFHSIKRAPVVVTSEIATNANAHCSNLFSAIEARGTTVSTDDRNMIYNMVSTAMATDLVGLAKPMDGSDPLFDYTNHRSLWQSIGMMGLFFGPYDGLVDFKDPTNVFTISGSPVKSNNLGYTFNGAANQYIDTKKVLNAVSQVGPWAHTLTGIITQNNMTGTTAKTPIMGAGPTFGLKIAGPELVRGLPMFDQTTAFTLNVPDTFTFSLGTSVADATDAGRVAIGAGIYSAVRREQSVTVWKNANRKVPFYAAYTAARDMVVGHAPTTIPALSFKVGTDAAGTTGANASVGGFILGRYWSDEEHATMVKLLKPLTDKYGVPLGV